MQITDNTITEIRSDKRLRRALIDLFDISERSLYRWLDEGNSRLTEIGCLNTIAIYLKKDINELIDEPILVFNEK